MERSIVTAAALLTMSAALLLAQSATDLFQQALELERGKGDITGAMQIYQRIVREFPSDKSVAANALFRLGYSQERIGQSQARNSYQQLIREYADQTAVADEARIRLAALTEAEAAPRSPTIFIAEMDPRTGTVRGPAVRLTQGSAGEDRYPTWSTDGKTIAFKRTVTEGGKSSTSIVLRSLDTRVEKTGAQADPGASFWLPNGDADSGLASRKGNVVNRDNPDGSSQVLVNLGFTAHDVAMAPGGRTLYALVLARNDVYLSSTIVPFDVATGERKQPFVLLSGSAGPNDIRNLGNYISVSPDGRMLAIARWTGERQPRIGRWGIDGTGYGESAVGRGLIQCVTWAKDGRSILFARSDDGAKWQILRVVADGSAPVFTGLEVTGLTYFDLNPGGSRIAFDGTAYAIREADLPSPSR